MTATDELRRLLDERGVEYDGSFGGIEFYGEDGSVIIACNPKSKDGVLYVHAYLTPEQAVEATLGRGECRNLIAHIQGQMPMLHCEECGCTTTLNVPSGGAGYAGETEMRWPRFCSNCGRKVVDA